MKRQINQSIVIDAKIKATLEGMNDVVSNLNKGLREGTAKIDLTKGIGNSISKQIETFKTEYSKFIQLTKDGKIEFGDTKDAIRSGEQMVKTFSELKRVIGNFEDMSLLDAKKIFPDAFDSKVDALSKKLKTLHENIVSLDSKKIELNDARQALSDLTAKQQDLQKELSEQLEVKVDTETAEQNLEEAKKKISELRDELKKELSEKLAGTDSIKNSLEAQKEVILNARKARGVTSEPLSGAQIKAAGGSKEQQANASQALKLYNSEKAELKEIEEALKKNVAAAKEYRKALTSADSAKLTDLADKAESSESKINEITNALKNQEQAQIDLNEASERRKQQETKISSIKKNLDETTRSLELQEQKVNKLQTAYDQLIAKTNPEELTKAFKELGIDFTPEMVKNEQSVRQLQEQLNALDEQDHQKLIQSLQEMGLSADQAEEYVKQLKGQLTTIDDSAKDISRAAQEMENLKDQVLQFFSITNAIQLFKRIVQSALNTVKELDAVMTETAVVTDFTVGDMWNKLPVYSKQATALGASIKDLYSATTLYYQQGLKTEAAMGVGIETMKMARIANMDAADATTAMTAALRGFNMEVNELNAQRVNDVYSELAAITAADTSQIATAMGKTASIASSANMEFETTAALLAQIIETTQEAPETAGTALKTIIARFAEVKKLRSEGTDTGKDEEGEIIDVNKIQGALRTVGISMNEFFAGAEGLDSILLKLAGKWNTLDFETQRYIATTAAGSRQQSRFIAMMSDYERTMELATAANNSAGASQKQFDKTLKSMEAKLQKLKNAWDEFTMGLANNEILKFGVDVLTGLLSTINKLTASLSGGNGLVKSILNLSVAFMGLKTGGTILNSIFASVGSAQAGKGLNFGANLKESFSKSFSNWKITPKINFDDTSLKVYQTSLTSLQQSQKKVAFYENILSQTRKNSSVDLSKNTTLTYLKTEAEKQLNMATTQLAATTGLENEQAKEAVLLNTQGISLDYAVVAAKEGLTQAKLREAAITVLGTEATEEEIRAKMQEILVEKTGYVTRNVGIMGRIEEIAMTKLGTISVIAKTWADKMETRGIQAKTAAMVASLVTIGLITAAIVALIALIVVIGKALYKASPAGQLEAANEAAEQAAEAANSAAEAYDNLKTSLESIEGKEEALEELTIGTKEWKEAVSELNNEVLDLINKYPELAKFVKSEKGILTLSEEIIDGQTVDSILESYQNTQISAQAAKVATNIQVQKSQQDVDFDNLDDRLKLTRTEKIEGIYETETGETTQVIDRAGTDELAKQLASGKISTNNAQLDFLKNIEDGYDKFLEYGRKLLASESAIEVFTNSLENAAIVNADVSEEYKDKLSGVYDTEAIENMLAKEEENIDLSKNRKYYEEEYARAMNYQYENGKFYTGEGENKKPVTVLDQDIKSQLAAIKVQDQLTQNIQQMTGILERLGKSTNKLDNAFANVITKANGAGLTLQDLSELSDTRFFNQKYEQAYNAETGKFNESELQKYYEQFEGQYSPEDFYRIFSNAVIQGSKSKDQVSTKLSSIGLGDLETGIFYKTKIDVGSLHNIANELYDVFITSGKEATSKIGIQIDKIMDNLDTENAQIFANALNMIDWTNVDSVKGLSEILEDMNFKGPINDIKNLEQEIINGTKAARNFSLEKVRDELKSLGDIIKDLKGRKDDERTFTTEEKDEILEKIPQFAAEFVMTGADEWVFIGNSIADLIIALNKNTSALLENTGDQIRDAADRSREWERYMKGTNEFSYKKEIYPGSNIFYTEQQGTFAETIARILNGTITDQKIITPILKQLGLDTNGDVPEQVARLREDYNRYYANAQVNYDKEEDWIKNERMAELFQQDSYTLANQVKNGYDNSEILTALKAQATYVGITTNELERYEKILADTGKEEEELTASAYAMAISMKKQQTAINESSKAIGEYLETMDSAEVDSVEYNSALSKIPDQLEKAFGFKPDTEWVQEHLGLIKEWAAGSEKAGAQIWENLTNGFSSAMAACEADVGQSVINMVGWLNWFSGTKVWAKAYLDNSGFMNAIATSETEAKEFADWLKKQGYETELVQVGADPMSQRVREYKGDMVEFTDTTVMQPMYQIRWRNTGNPWTGDGNRYNAPPSYTPKSGSDSEPEKRKNPYDKFYNTVQKLNEELRKRNKLEREYQRLLDNSNTSGEDLVRNAEKQLVSLENEKKTREELLKNRERQMNDIEEENSQYSDYARYNKELGVIEIDWEKIDILYDSDSTDEEFIKGLEEFISKLEDQEKLIEEEEDALDEIEDTVKEIRDQGKDEYFDFENQIRDALEQARQKEIDKLSAINDSINDTNTRLLDAMQSSIDKYRQDRENERTEKELSDKQRRLAYLQQDTSGANALDILRLQEEIDQETENYTDTLVDKKINELKEQNDKAAKQRQEQIKLLETQKDIYLESGRVWQDVYTLLRSGFDGKGIKPGSDLENLLKEGASFNSLSEQKKMDWLKTLENTTAKAYQWLTIGNSTESLLDKGELKNGQEISFITADGKKVTGTLDDKGNVTTESGKKYKDIYRTYNGTFVTDENYITADDKEPTDPPAEDTEVSELDTNTKRGVSAAIWNGNYGWGNEPYRSERLEEVFGKNDIQENYVEKYVTNGYTGKISDYSYENMKKKFKKFKTGGIADFTGPAWLDGTKSKPEYILNAEQTKSFFQLIDVLGSLKNGTTQNSQIIGDSIYDVDINVESISSDYDVEQLASIIKRMINDDARYRNNNAINLQR